MKGKSIFQFAKSNENLSDFGLGVELLRSERYYGPLISEEIQMQESVFDNEKGAFDSISNPFEGGIKLCFLMCHHYYVRRLDKKQWNQDWTHQATFALLSKTRKNGSNINAQI